MDDRSPTDGHQDEVYGLRVPAGKRTYFFDVKTTRAGHDFFLTITESKRLPGDYDDSPPRYEKHKIYLYKEDFGKFVDGLMEAIEHIREERLPDYDFTDVPRVAR
jgi:hypothetical protein